jgi:hypothetical protein
MCHRNNPFLLNTDIPPAQRIVEPFSRFAVTGEAQESPVTVNRLGL